MNNYFIQISFASPYPIVKSYQIESSNLSGAVGKATRQWRKEVKGKKIKEVNIKVTRL